MKTIPSLVASSTVGIAAAGLALGKPERTTPPRPTSKKRKAGDLAEVVVHNRGSSSPYTRPGTSTTVITPESRPSRPPTGTPSNPTPILRQRASTTRVEINNNNAARRFSIFRHDDLFSAREHLEEDTRRESISSRGSWMRRLSIIPNSYDTSPRSSVGPDSPSINSFNGSAVPILSNPGSSPAQLPPNKLVKRGTSTRQHSGPPSTSRTTKSDFPTLRRPATSHQRSITLQQQFRDDSMGSEDSSQQAPAGQARSAPAKLTSPSNPRHAWRLYFDSRPTKLVKERPSGKSTDDTMHNFQSTSKRVLPDDAVRPTLIKPEMITVAELRPITYFYDDSLELEDPAQEEADFTARKVMPSTETLDEPQKRPRRSLSMHFGSPTSWISRSGSLRGHKRYPEGRSGGGKRYASAPVPSMPGRGITSAHDSPNIKPRPIMDPSVFQAQQAEAPSPSDPFSTSFQSRNRTSSSPLPPLSRLSSFNLDLARLGLSSSSSSAPRRSPSSTLPNTTTTATSIASTSHPSPVSTTYFLPNIAKNNRSSPVTDRTSTLIGSDHEIKGFASGDEDEMDYQSETVYDSLRSGATSSSRSHNALESMFEESPPSVNGHAKSKRLSIHEMLSNGTFQEESERIIEEDEGMPTPVKARRTSQDQHLRTPMRMDAMEMDEAFPSSPPSFALTTKDFARLLLDDEEDDEDWTRDDENMDVSNPLSPPSSSLNSRKVSPSFRAALADVTHNTSSVNGNTSTAERPRSNVFDWSEPTAEKVDSMGNSPRPRTAHVKQIADIRGGRAIGRRGPSALHIRSQSVPVVPDVAGQRDHSKLTPKFGTWGLGAKGVSEDWDNDFEFESNSETDANDGDSKIEISGMLVPPAIQASQASVVGHVGQIREVCLLVEDLKRLRLLAREKGLLDGPSAPLWKEAEGIIALAVPDEEDLALSPPSSPSSVALEVEDEDQMDDRYHDDGPEIEDLSRPDAPFEVLNRHGRPTGYVYDGNHVRRRSVFAPDDDIFGAGLINTPPVRDHLRPASTSPRHSSMKTSSEVARSVMETMHQHRSTSDPVLQNMSYQSPNKMPFDTTSLRDLVHRASNLSRTLSDLIRKADGRSESPEVTFVRDSSPAFTRVFSDPGDLHQPEASVHHNSSPAFTRVFTDPMASPPKSLPRSHSNNSVLSGTIDESPTRSLGNRIQMMTVV